MVVGWGVVDHPYYLGWDYDCYPCLLIVRVVFLFVVVVVHSVRKVNAHSLVENYDECRLRHGPNSSVVVG